MRWKTNLKLWLLLLLGLGLRLGLASWGTLSLDQNTFVAWSRILVEGGLTDFYNGWSDYLPGYLYVLWALGKINALGVLGQTLLFKLPAILADVATGFLICKIVSGKKGMLAAGLYIFNPAVLANSTLWGQVDSLTAFFGLLAIWLTARGSIFGAWAMAVGTLVKPQAAFGLPVSLFLFWRDKWDIKKILIYLMAGLAVFVLGFLPFSGGQSLPAFVVERIGVTVNQYPYTSVNAFNFWGLTGFWRPDLTWGLSYLGYLGAIILSFWKLRKQKGVEYLLLAISFAASFLFLTRMHERHLLPALAPLAIAGATNSAYLISYFVFSATYVTNLYYAFNWVEKDFLEVIPNWLIKVLIIFNLGAFINLLTKFAERLRFERRLLRTVPKVAFPKMKLGGKGARWILVGILAFAGISRLLFLGNPQNEYFDEVYHAFTARRILHGDADTWAWWTTPPTGFAYEWTHPPLAKLGMTLGMLVLGENSWGWRLPGAILGTAVIYLVYRIGKRLFEDESVGLLAAGVAALDGLPLVMGRIGMNDTYLLFFILLAFYLFLTKRNFWSGLALGLAAASKWSVAWLIPILALTHFSFKRKFSWSYIWFLILPPLVYLASYIPMFLAGHNFDIFIGVQKQMWWYHTRLTATHAYTSPALSWPLMIRPIYLYVSETVNNLTGKIYAMGNPVVFWGGAAAVMISFWLALRERNRKLGLVLFSYLAFFVPWIGSPRIMFLYHYLPSLPFLAIVTAFVLRRFPKILPYFFVAGGILFVYFFPHWTGIKIPLWLDESYYWFSSWR